MSAKVSYPGCGENVKQKRDLATFLRRHTDNFDWATAKHSYADGQLVKEYSGRPTTAAMVAALESKVWHFLEDVKNRHYFAHFDGEAHVYAAGRFFRPKDLKEWGYARTIVYIDIDCKTIGSAKGSLDLTNFLASNECKQTYGFSFPNLYSEPSSNKQGRAAWFILDYGRDGAGTRNLKPALKQLGKLLNQVVRDQRFDIEKVEIKSTPSEVRWSGSKGKVESFTMGTLARLPRDADRVEELKATTVFTIPDLQRLPRPTNTRVSTRKPAVKKERTAGSSTGSLLTEDRFERLPYYQGLAAKIMGGADAVIQTSGRMVANVQDMAVALMILEACTEKMNPDGSLPTARAKMIWQQAFDDGWVDRGYHRARFSVLRNRLSSLGLLEVEDMSYRIGTKRGTERTKGKACKWKLSETLLTWLKEVRSVEGGGVYLSCVQHEHVDATSSSDYPVPTAVVDLKLHLDPAVLAEIDRIVGSWTPSSLAA